MRRTCTLIPLIVFVCTPLCAQSSREVSYPDSADGFRQQLEDLIATKKSGDAPALRAKLEALTVPNANEWIATRFLPSDVARLQRDYPLSLTGFQRHLTWVIENAANLPGWEIAVTPSELPRPPAPYGKEANVPVPTEAVGVENFRYGPRYPEDKIQRFWVNSFLYIDGQFRYVGGTYPFWAEELQGMRASEATPLTELANRHVTSARLIRRVAPEYPKKARKKGVEGVVRLHAIIGKDGTVQELTLVYGDPLLTDAALKAVRQWRYEPMRLNGDPVEVDTTIDVSFSLNR